MTNDEPRTDEAEAPDVAADEPDPTSPADAVAAEPDEAPPNEPAEAPPNEPGEAPADEPAAVDPPSPAEAPPGAVVRWARQLGRSAVVAVALLTAVGVGLMLGRAAGDAPEEVAGEAGTQWTCSMHPQIRMSEPGQCPICGMKLVPVEKASTAGPSARVTLSKTARALAAVETTVVVRTEPRAEIRLLGRVDYDETRLKMVTPWTDGRIDSLQVRVTGEKIKKGQVVAMLYSPEIYAAMRDLVVALEQAKKLAGSMHGADRLSAAAAGAAREKLRLLGVSDAQIKSIEKTKKTPKQVAIRSSFSGTVLERSVQEGDYVKAGTVLFHVADLSRVWVQIDAYESDLPHLRVGQQVVVEIESRPGETFTGEVAFIDPVVDPKTRTARVRVEVENEDRDLRPGMFAQALVEAEPGDEESYLVIPASAVLFTGRRSVVYVAVPGKPGTYDLREVRLGPRTGPVYPVLSGLAEGEVIVTRGAFVLDADLQLAGGRSMMTLPDDRAAPDQPEIPVTAANLAALAPVVTAYLDVQAHLAADELDAARKGLGALATAVNEVELSGPKATREAWQPIASQLSGHGRHGAKAPTDGEVRAAFEHVSMQVLALLRTFGNPTDAPLRLAQCPMAFDQRGAQWVQRDERLANPYYGAEMLRCGDFEATVLPAERLPAAAVEAAPPPPAAAGSQHQH